MFVMCVIVVYDILVCLKHVRLTTGDLDCALRIWGVLGRRRERVVRPFSVLRF